MSDLEKIAHDLRAPLARAKTLQKLLSDADDSERARYSLMLADALNELDAKISELVEKSD